MRVYHRFTGYIADEIEESLAEISILSHARLFTWIVFDVRCTAEQETGCGLCQKLYVNKFEAHLKLSVAQLAGRIRQFV